MLRLATVADVNGKLVRALRRRRRDIDLERVLDRLPESAADPDVLEWAAAHNRVLISNDRNTMVKHAWERVIRKKNAIAGADCHDECAADPGCS